MRCFVAVDLDERLREKITGLQRTLEGFDVELVEPQNLHFTLKFLGEADEQVIEKVKTAIKEISSGFKPFDVHVQGAGVFPSIDYVRVIWIGCDDLFNLQNTVEDALAPLFKKEKPIPHLTIARARSATHKDEIKDFVNRNRGIEIGMMRVNMIKLKKSTLTKQGPIYEDVETFDMYDIGQDID